jgi:hypothetical protein
MEKVNRILKGLHMDNDPRYQPEDTMRASLNGTIMSVGNNRYAWRPIGSTELLFSLAEHEKYMGHCRIRKRLFLLTHNTNTNTTRLLELIYDAFFNVVVEQRWSGVANPFSLNVNHPIRSMVGFYETEDLQKIYFTDYHNQPRVIHVNNDAVVTITEKFSRFYPQISPGWGNFSFVNLTNNGSLLAGSYFFAWQLYTNDGASTDWSYLSNPVHIAVETSSVGTLVDYPRVEGRAPDFRTSKAITLRLEGIDNDYNNIRIAAFYSNDYNSAGTGEVFIDAAITGANMTFVYQGNENIDTIIIDDLVSNSTVIEKAKEMLIAEKMNIIGGIKEREELDLTHLAGAKNSQVRVNIANEYYEVPLDITAAGTIGSANLRAAYAPPKVEIDQGSNILRPGVWYKVTSVINLTYLDPSMASFSHAPGERFKIATRGTIVAGAAVPLLRRKRYRISPGVFKWEEQELTGYMDYKNPQVANFVKGYPSDEIIRLGIVFYDKTGRPFFARHLINIATSNDFRTPKRNIAGNHYLVHYTPQVSPDYFEDHNARVSSLVVSGIDVTAFRHLIGGFSIVRAPIVRTRIASGILSPVERATGNPLSLHKASAGYQISTALRKQNVYAIYSPELLFGLRGVNIEPGDKISVNSYLKPYLTGLNNPVGGLIYTVGTNSYIQKCYEHRNSSAPATGNGALNAVNDIFYNTPFKVGDQNIMIDPRDPNTFYSHITSDITISGTARGGLSGRCNVLVSKNVETPDDYIGKKTDSEANAILPLCDILRENNAPYGGLSDGSLANTIYISTGHYQEVNDAVLAEIQSGGSYIFNDVQVFGGDTFVNLMAIERLTRDPGVAKYLSNIIVFPCESRVNIALREGNNVAKNLSYDITHCTDGIRFKVNDHKWEEFNYNDGYSSDNINDFYLPLPFKWEDRATRGSRIRYSKEKNYGEKIDSFRIFPPFQYLDLDPNFGDISNLKEKFSRIFYWQKDAVGYIPIRERQLTQNPMGQPIQLGVGGVFERHDRIIDKMGNSNQFGLVESDMGFHWFDANRKIYLTLSSNMQMQEDSVIGGMDNFFNNLPNMSGLDNPLFQEGILSGYDPKNKMIYTVFNVPDEGPTTIGLNLKYGAFAGMFSFPAIAFMRMNGSLIGIRQGITAQRVHLHTNKVEFGSYYGQAISAYFDIVFTGDGLEPMIWDNIEVAGNNRLCTHITYSFMGRSATEQVVSYSPSFRILSPGWSYRNNRWYGNLPLLSRERMVNDYLVIRFHFNGGFTLEQFITFVKTTFRQTF